MSRVDKVTINLDAPEAPEAVKTECDCQILVPYNNHCKCESCDETICKECYDHHEKQCRPCDEKGSVTDNIRKANDVMYEKLKEFKQQLEEQNGGRN